MSNSYISVSSIYANNEIITDLKISFKNGEVEFISDSISLEDFEKIMNIQISNENIVSLRPILSEFIKTSLEVDYDIIYVAINDSTHKNELVYTVNHLSNDKNNYTLIQDLDLDEQEFLISNFKQKLQKEISLVYEKLDEIEQGFINEKDIVEQNVELRKQYSENFEYLLFDIKNPNIETINTFNLTEEEISDYYLFYQENFMENFISNLKENHNISDVKIEGRSGGWLCIKPLYPFDYDEYEDALFRINEIRETLNKNLVKSDDKDYDFNERLEFLDELRYEYNYDSVINELDNFNLSGFEELISDFEQLIQKGKRDFENGWNSFLTSCLATKKTKEKKSTVNSSELPNR
jgi:hypothetical protein